MRKSKTLNSNPATSVTVGEMQPVETVKMPTLWGPIFIQSLGYMYYLQVGAWKQNGTVQLTLVAIKVVNFIQLFWVRYVHEQNTVYNLPK